MRRYLMYICIGLFVVARMKTQRGVSCVIVGSLCCKFRFVHVLFNLVRMRKIVKQFRDLGGTPCIVYIIFSVCFFILQVLLGLIFLE